MSELRTDFAMLCTVTVLGAVASCTAPAPAEITKDAGVVDAAPDARFDPVEQKHRAKNQITAALTHAEPAVRLQALEEIRTMRAGHWNEQVRALLDDPDPEVRAMAAVSLGYLSVTEVISAIADRHEAAEPALRVWYAEALVRLGHPKAHRWLVRYASSKQLDVAFQAAIALADTRSPGDKKAIRALTRLSRRESELPGLAGITILAGLTRLGHGRARDRLRGLLDDQNEIFRIAAAESLAAIGDDAGFDVLMRAFNDGQSKHRLKAGLGLIFFGDVSAYDYLLEQLDSREAGIRRKSLRGLGKIGEPDSLDIVRRLCEDEDETVRVAAASAVLFLLGLDPNVLARESVDWIQTALRDKRWAVRRDAAGPMRSLPEKDAAPLFTVGIGDRDPRVRREFARAAIGATSQKMVKAASDALDSERDPDVQEQLVTVLGKSGQSDVKAQIEALASTDNKVGVRATAMLVALGDVTAVSRLAQAYDSGKASLRLATMESAVAADSGAVVPVLEQGLDDRAFEVRFTAAEGFAHYRIARDKAVKVLREGNGRAPAIAGRAMAALLALDVSLQTDSVRAMLESADTKTRLAALPALSALGWRDARPLLRRAMSDAEPVVRGRALDALDAFTDAHRQESTAMLKQAVSDSDATVRATARAQLAPLLAKRTPVTAKPEPRPVDLGPMQRAVKAARDAADALDAHESAIDALIEKIHQATRTDAQDEDHVDAVKQMGQELKDAESRLWRALGQITDKARNVSSKADTLATAPPEAHALLADARAVSRDASERVSEVSQRARKAHELVKKYLARETASVETYLSAAEVAIEAGRLPAAQRDLSKAERLNDKNKQKDPRVDYAWGLFHDKQADAIADPERQRSLRIKAKQRYDRFIPVGAGYRLEFARERSAEIAAEIAAEEASRAEK